MYWHNRYFKEELDERECREAAERINALLGGRAPAPVGVALTATVSVLNVKRRRLPFYPHGWWLYRFECRIRKISGVATLPTCQGAFFCVSQARGESRGTLDDPTLLDWTRAPIHRVNAIAPLDLVHEEESLLTEYANFYASFVGTEGHEIGADRREPVALPSDFSALSWEDNLELLEDVAKHDKLQVFATHLRDEPPDPFDFPDPAPATPNTAPGFPPSTKGTGSPAEKRQRVKDCFTTLGSNPRIIDSTQMRARFEAIAWHRGVLHLVNFSVFRDGMVELKRDHPLAGGEELPVWWWESRKLHCGIWVLLHKADLERLQNTEVIKRLTEDPCSRFHRCRIYGDLTLALTLSQQVRFEDVEFTGKVAFDESVFKRSVEFRNCRFLQSLSFKNVTVNDCLVLTNSTIEGALPVGAQPTEMMQPALVLTGLTVGQNLIADRLGVQGMISGKSMCIAGAFKARGLRAKLRECGKSGTQIDFSRSSIGGIFDLSSFGDYRFEPGASTRTRLGGCLILKELAANAVNLSGAHIDGNVDLSLACCAGRVELAPVWLSPVGGKYDRSARAWRTQVTQTLFLAQASLKSLVVDGCFIGGDLRMIETVVAASVFARLDGRFRCQIAGKMFASSAHVGGVFELHGISIAGELMMITGSCTRLRAECGIWFSPDGEGYEARLERAQIGGVLLESITMSAEVLLLAIKVHQPKEPSTDIAEVIPDTAGGEAPQTTKVPGSIVVRNVRLGGGFQLWREDAEEIVTRRARRVFNDAGLQGAPLKVAPEAIQQLRASIDHDLDLRGISAGSTVDLGRAFIAGRVRLGNSGIDGDLRAAEAIPTHCRSFEARGAKITGNVDLKGLEVSNDLVARGLEAGGRFLLTGPENEDETQYYKVEGPEWISAKVTGKIRLEAISVAKLRLTAGNIVQLEEVLEEVCPPTLRKRVEHQLREAVKISHKYYSQLREAVKNWRNLFPEKETELALITLARARVGHLQILGFRDYKHGKHFPKLPLFLRRFFGIREKCFPVTIDLTRIEVGEWNIDPDTEVIPLLKKTQPFDRQVYLTIEERLSKLGLRAIANRTWRAMVWRNARDYKSRLPGALLNSWFSRQGTWPLLMAFWLLFSISVLTWGVLVDYRNVVDHEGEQVCEQSWDWQKAFMLAFGYAVPPYKSSRFEPPRANQDDQAHVPRWLEKKIFWLERRFGDPPKAGTCLVYGTCNWKPSPQDLAEMMSIVQVFLWLLVAANLPAIIRRRG
jgi:hypothetical protein